MDPLTKDEEMELVEAFQAGDEAAGSKLCEKLHKPILGYALGRGAGIGSMDLEDAAQNAWLDGIEKIRNGVYDPEYRVFTFIKGILDNKLLQQKTKLGIDITKMIPDDIADVALKQRIESPVKSPDVDIDENEFLKLRFEAYSKFLQYFFLCSGYPHRQLAFLHNKQTFGYQDKEDGIRGRPAEVNRKYGESTLVKMAEDFWTIYEMDSCMDSATMARLRAYMHPMEIRFGLKVKELMGNSSELTPDLKKKGMELTGTTILRDYYGKKGHGAISDWCDKVIKRMRKILGLEDGNAQAAEEELLHHLLKDEKDIHNCPKLCPLRNVPPCMDDLGK